MHTYALETITDWQTVLLIFIEIWAATWQNQRSECAPSEDSDQPWHPPSLIRFFAIHMKKTWVLRYPFSAQRRLWSDWADAQADLSLCWVHIPFLDFVMSRLICNIKKMVNANLCSWRSQFVAYRVANPEDRFYCDGAHIIHSSPTVAQDSSTVGILSVQGEDSPRSTGGTIRMMAHFNI